MYEITAEDAFNSTTGYEEMAVRKAFGASLVGLAKEEESLTFARALVYVMKRRDGLDDRAAKDAALSMTIGDLQTAFAEENEADPDSPLDNSGN